MDIIEAIKRDNLIEVKKLLKDGVDPNLELEEIPLLVIAINEKADLEIIEELIKAGANIFYTNEDGVSLLDEAIEAKNLEVVKFLVDNGIDVNSTKRGSGFTPLMLASTSGNGEMVKFLLQNGANKETKDRNGLTALDYAIKTEQKKVIPLLS